MYFLGGRRIIKIIEEVNVNKLIQVLSILSSFKRNCDENKFYEDVKCYRETQMMLIKKEWSREFNGRTT